MKFSDNLRSLRKEREFSQEYLAEKMNVSRQTISKWENGSAMPDLKKLTELADLFNVSMDYLLGTKIEDTESTNSLNDCREYIDQIVSAIYSNQQQVIERKSKKQTIILSLAIIAVSIALIITNTNISANISSLNNRIDNLPQYTNVNYDNDDTDQDFFIDYNFLGVNRQKPNILKIKLIYSAKESPKNAVVFFSIPKKDGTNYKFTAENKDGSFTATGDIDLTLVNNEEYCYVCIDDDVNLKRYEFEICYYEYRDIIDDVEFTFKGDGFVCNNNEFLFNDGVFGKVINSYLIFENKGEVVLKKELDIQNNNKELNNEYTYKAVMPSNIPINLNTFDKVYIMLECDNAVQEKYGLVCYYDGDERIIDNSETWKEISFNGTSLYNTTREAF